MNSLFSRFFPSHRGTSSAPPMAAVLAGLGLVAMLSMAVVGERQAPSDAGRVPRALGNDGAPSPEVSPTPKPTPRPVFRRLDVPESSTSIGATDGSPGFEPPPAAELLRLRNQHRLQMLIQNQPTPPPPGSGQRRDIRDMIEAFDRVAAAQAAQRATSEGLRREGLEFPPGIFEGGTRGIESDYGNPMAGFVNPEWLRARFGQRATDILPPDLMQLEVGGATLAPLPGLTTATLGVEPAPVAP